MRTSRELKSRPFEPDRFASTLAVLRSGVAEGGAPGFVAGLWSASDPDAIRVEAVGKRRIYPSEQALGVETYFDLASVTKVMGTAALAAVLVERGWIRWGAPVRGLLPDFPHRGITLGHLLAHTSGLPAWMPLWERMRDRFAPAALPEVSVKERQRFMRELVFAAPLEARPGERAVYSDLSFLTLGFALEEATAMPLDRAVRSLVWDAMGIEGAAYVRTDGRGPPTRIARDVAATEESPWRGGPGGYMQGEVHDENCWAMGGYAGHAGAFGRARDVLHFASRLMEGFLTDATMRRAWSRVGPPFGPAGCERTLGWDTPSGPSSSAGSLFSTGTVGHLGFTGTSLWIDPEAGLAIVLLSNRVHPSRENTKIRELRPRFHTEIRREAVDARV